MITQAQVGGQLPGARPRRRWPAVLVATAASAAAAIATCGVAAGSAAATPARTTLRAWGTNSAGELGHGTRSPFSETPVTVRIPKGVIVTSVRAGCDHSVALTSAGRVLSWGANNEGQLGIGNHAGHDRPVYAKLPKKTKISSVRAGCEDTIALTTTGRVLTWGLGVEGQLGNGSTRNRTTPGYVRLPKGTKVTGISAGCHDNLAVTSRGQVLAFGQGLEGELGNGSTHNRDTPVYVRLPKGTKATSVTAGCRHDFAMTNNGLFGWGYNGDGELGDGNTISTDRPVEIFFLTRGLPLGRITGLFAGCAQTIALFSRGAVLAWGDNAYGELGNGSNSSSDKPVGVMVPGGDKVTAVTAGCRSSFAVTTQGQVLAWGYNAEGQLGEGIGISTNTPVPVSLPAGFGTIAIGTGPGAQHTFVIAKAG